MSATMAPVPRASSSQVSGSKTPNLPVIQHPMSKLGNKNELTIRGSSSTGFRQESVHTLGFQSAAVRRNVDDVRKSAPDRILQWPPVRRIEYEDVQACEIDAPFGYTPEVAGEAGLTQREIKDGNVKAMRDLVLPPIDTHVIDQGEATPSSKRKLKFPSLEHIMEIVEEKAQEHVLGPKNNNRTRKPENFQNQTSRNLFEVYDMVREKMTTGFNGIKHLFKANDPTGKGTVSREALLRILYSLCGYISTEQYTKFLKKLGLDGRESFTFDNFMSCFKDNETVKKEWVSPVQKVLMEQAKKLRHPEENLRQTDMLTAIPFMSAPFSDDLLKQKIRTIEDARRYFPAACFEPNGMIVPPQMREAFAQNGIYMTDRDFDTIWQKYDKDGLGAVFTRKYLKKLGVVDPSLSKPQTAREFPETKISTGVPRPNSNKITPNNNKENEQINMDVGNTEKENSPETAKETGNEKVTKHIEVRIESNGEGNDDCEGEPQAKKVKIPKRKRYHPKLDNIIDCLHYKFEESYNAILAAFKLFDFMNDGYISRVDFRRCIQEFGFSVKMTDLDGFLSKVGLRSVKGQINYQELLAKFQSRSDNSIMNKILNSQNHIFRAGVMASEVELSADELEARLVQYFHGDFIRLVSHYRTCDKYNLGVVTATEFRSGIERLLGYQMMEKQWEQLQNDVGKDSDGLVPYYKFLQFFDIVPGTWNKKVDNGIVVPQVHKQNIELPPEVDKLKETARVEMVPHDIEMPKADGRNLNDIYETIKDLFLNRFHIFDKNFKDMDRKMVGRMSKWQFGALLKLSGVTLTPEELDKLWVNINPAQDGMYSYSSLIQHFTQHKTKTVEKKDISVQELCPLFPKFPARKRRKIRAFEKLSARFEESAKDLVEAARRVQRERTEKKRTEEKKESLQVRTETATVRPAPPLSAQKTASTLQTTVPVLHNKPVSFPPTPLGSVPGSAMSSRSVRTKELLVKIKSDVISNWEGLKSVFKFIDKNGTATISKVEMMDVLDSMKFKLSFEEKDELCRRFDLRRNGRFHYIEFMKCFSQRTEPEKSKTFCYNKHTHTLKKKQSGTEITVANILNELRDKLMTEHSNLRRAFKKLDVHNKGYLSVMDFRKGLRQCGMDVSNQDFYHIMTEFDRRLAGKISYDDFLATFIDL